jgi:hypothetical protein
MLGLVVQKPPDRFKECLGGLVGRNLVTNGVFKWLLWFFPAGKRPERAKKPIGNQISAQKAPKTPLKPYPGRIYGGFQILVLVVEQKMVTK